MEVSINNDQLCDNQIKILYLISGDASVSAISERLNLSQAETDRLIKEMMRKWGVKNYTRLVIEGLIRAYTDVGFQLDNASLLYFMQRISISERLSIVLLDYYDLHKTIDNSIRIKTIDEKAFLEIEGSSVQLWNEFRAEILTYSARIRQATRKLGVDLTI